MLPKTRYNSFAVESGIKLNRTVLQASGCVLHPDKETMYRFVADRLHLDKDDEIAGLELTLKANGNDILCVSDRGDIDVVEDAATDFIIAYQG